MYINFVCTSVSLSIERSTQYVYTLLEKDHFHTHCVCTCVYKLCVCVCVCRENEPGWEVDIREDVLEECSQFGAVLHIYVDKLSQGNVYVKCMTAQTATAAFANLNGRFFAGMVCVLMEPRQCWSMLNFMYSNLLALPCSTQASRLWLSMCRSQPITPSFQLPRLPSRHSNRHLQL